MSQTTTKVVRPAGATFTATGTATTLRSAAQFDEARRNRMAIANPKGGFVISPKDAAPGAMLIGVAIAEAIFVEPIRALRRKLRA
jgi:hypothetical protein